MPEEDESNMVRKSVTMPLTMGEFVDEFAKEDDRSASWVIRKAVTALYREHYEGDPPWE
jgi:hypothetical protein